MDGWTLRVIQHQGPAVVPVFEALFARNPIDRVLRFLEERSGLWETLDILRTLPPRVFFDEGRRLLTARRALPPPPG